MWHEQLWQPLLLRAVVLEDVLHFIVSLAPFAGTNTKVHVAMGSSRAPQNWMSVPRTKWGERTELPDVKAGNQATLFSE